jgi:hypothetical protein
MNNRWRQRLQLLHTEPDERGPAFHHFVQNVQNVQNPLSVPAFEHSEHFEHRSESASAPVAVDRVSAAATEFEEQPDYVDPLGWTTAVARLDPVKPPAEVPAERWQQFVDDARQFLAGPFCEVAVALGWSSLDLFGCHATRPYARIDQAGLVHLLNGERIVALTAMTAVIETATEVRKTYFRTASELGRVLAWQL